MGTIPANAIETMHTLKGYSWNTKLLFLPSLGIDVSAFSLTATEASQRDTS